MELTGKQEIELAHELGYSKYNKVCRSLASRPELTGVCRVPRLKRAMALGQPKKAARKDPCRLSCWLSEAHRAEFNHLKTKLGIEHDKDLVVWLIDFAKERLK